MKFETLDFAKQKLNEGARVNQRCGRDKYCQIVHDDFVVGFIKPADYKILILDPELEEQHLKASLEFRGLRVIVKKGN